MSARQFLPTDRPTPAEVVAAATELDSWGRLHGWFARADYASLDPISKDEFEAIVERVLMSAAAVRRGVDPTGD